VRGVVYDVTMALSTHPAGIQTILRHAATDATKHFDFHSPRARQMWKKYEIGRLEGYKENMCTIQ
jgi:cytochrome b involved in lipid metabolism